VTHRLDSVAGGSICSRAADVALLRPGNWPGTGPAIGFLKVPEPKTAKNSMHIDVLTGESPWDMTNDEVPAEGAESTELGDLS